MYPEQNCRWHKIKSVYYTRELFCHPEGPPWAGEMGWQKPHAVHQHVQNPAYVGGDNTMYWYMLRATQLQSSLAEKDMGVLMDTKLTMTQNLPLWQRRLMVFCIRRYSLQVEGGDHFLLFSTGKATDGIMCLILYCVQLQPEGWGQRKGPEQILTAAQQPTLLGHQQCPLHWQRGACGLPPLKYCVHSWAPQYNWDMERLDTVQSWATTTVKEQNHLSSEER